jgi:trimeric autotransporter adhesin
MRRARALERLTVAATVVALAAGGSVAAAAGQEHGSHAMTAGALSIAAGGVGGPAEGTSVHLGPCGVSRIGGQTYIATGGSVRLLNARNDWLTTPVGAQVYPAASPGGPAADTALSDTCQVTADHHGNMVIADGEGQHVWVVPSRTGTFYGQVMTAGHIYSVAGGGRRIYSGVPAADADMEPDGVAVDSAGNLVIMNALVGLQVLAVRHGTFYGQAMRAGHVYIVDRGEMGAGLAADQAGNTVIAALYTNEVQVLAASTGTFYGQAMTAGQVYRVAGTGTAGYSGNGGPATAAMLYGPRGVSVDGAGNLLIADEGNNRVRVVAASTGSSYGQAMTAGHIYAIAGDGTRGYAGNGGPATAASLDEPEGVALDQAGNLVIADGFYVRVVAESTGTYYGQAMTSGDIYTVAGNGPTDFSGDGGLATRAVLDYAQGVTTDGAGNLLVTDTYGDRVVVVAATPGTMYGRAMTAGHLYSVAGTGVAGLRGQGTPATQAEFKNPDAAVADHHGNLVISDYGNSEIRVVAESTGTFYGQAMTTGDIYTVAGTGQPGYSGDGGPGTAAMLKGPDDVTVDGAGNLVIADEDNSRVRVVAASTGTFYGQAMTAGDIYTIAGTGTCDYSGDGGPAIAAELCGPSSIATDSAGNLVIADSANSRVRVVAASTGTLYGRAMTKGDIYTVAGDGTYADTGDGGPATSAAIGDPASVAVDPAGNLVIADPVYYAIRVVAAATGSYYGQAMTRGDIYTITSPELSYYSELGGVTTDSTGNIYIATGPAVEKIAG